MEIREFGEDDWSRVWPVVREIVRAGDTYAYEPDMSEERARTAWVLSPPGRTVVAVGGSPATTDSGAGDQVIGTARMAPIRPGPGSHVANASFMVSAEARGQGVGAALCRHALEWARASGYAGMQFSEVVETNRSAVALYERLGFSIVGTVPGAFEHPSLGRVGLHIMYCEF